MKKIFFILTIIAIFSCNKNETKINYPFPQNVNYSVNFIKPNFSQEQINSDVSNFYEQWKKKYIKICKNGDYYVDYDEGNTICVSEGQGYGMMIVVYMAGYDDEAKEIFDGLFRFAKNHPSSTNKNLMAWEQIDNCITNPDGGDDAASDGDIDIAYALLLADKQWGSQDEINYKNEADKIISAILKDEINTENYSVKLGDWVDSNDDKYFYATRTSDFILDHFNAFAVSTANNEWNKVISECYNLLDTIQKNYSQTSGLIPDFIVASATSPHPADPNFLEDTYDGNFYYNSCRVPWRLTVNYLLYSDSNSLKIIQKINNWLISETNNNPDNIASGYMLSGEPIHTDYQDICFYGAFAVSAMLTENQEWLDNLYTKMINEKIDDNGYFANTLKMLYLLAISQKNWKP